ncbi:proteoglycan 4b [Thalassophryne amazonica]|uniref:proteoglycan 4b n=1 Tax=Thalassophryne amazonica TaxID=390379 RepID=UPI0014709659|nr:proteoglycan 4b [Thalassophryne amazonica]
MPSTLFCAVAVLQALTFIAAQTNTCKGRCGSEYYRGYTCQCDYSCLSYEECCKDYERQCTTRDSCKGRCGEVFKRGQLCNCDPECQKYNQCCPDYSSHCNTQDMNHEILPADEALDNGLEDPAISPVPDSTTNSKTTVTNIQDITSTTVFMPQTSTVISQTSTTHSEKPTQVIPSSINPTTAAATAESADTAKPETESEPVNTDPQSPSTVQSITSQPMTSTAPQTGPPPTVTNPEPTDASSQDPQVFTLDPEKAENSNSSQESSPTTNPIPVTEPASNPTVVPVFTGSMQASTAPPGNTEPYTDSQTTITASLMPDVQGFSTSGSSAATENLSTFDPDSVPEKDSLTTNAPSTTNPAPDDETIANSLKSTQHPTKPAPTEPTTKPLDRPLTLKPSLVTPTSKPETEPPETPNVNNSGDYQADDSSDTNLCSRKPVSGVTTLRNGTMVVFRGTIFWFLDNNMEPGPAQDITQMWGVPSPIDTVFTRCNCQGKTYIFKGPKYWRFENDVLDPGYPKVIETGFGGLQGQVTAALSVPQYKNRRESVYFFKRGGKVQKYSYQFGTSPTCGRKPQYAIYTARSRPVRQAVSLLGPAITIQKFWRGFPTTITAAVSVPNQREPEGYKYYVFSKSTFYNIRMAGEQPVVAAPTTEASRQNDFFKCPKTI